MTSYKKFIFTVFLAIFVFSGLSVPQPANAFSDFIGGPIAAVKWVWEKTEKIYDKVQGIVGAELSNRTVGMFLDSFAYDVASQLAEGGLGGKPLFRTVSMKKSLETAGQQALGEFLGELTEKGFDELGINLCNPSLELKLTLTLGLIDQERPPKPSCEWTSLQNNWKRFGDDMQADLVKFQLDPRRSGSTSVNEYMKRIFSPDSTDLGAAFKLNAELNRRKLEAEKVHSLTIDECKGFISKKTTVSAEIITHCSQFENLAESFVENAGVIDAMKQLEKKLAAQNVTLSSILKDAGNKFIDTFSSKLMNNWIKKGMWSLFGDDDNDVYQEYRDTLLDRLRGGANIRQPRGVDMFKDFKSVNIESLESFDYLSLYAICPDEFRQPDNCTISPAFLQAINSKLTIQQAIDKGIIKGDMSLVRQDDPLNHTVNKCYRDNLCYGNLVKLRKANMIPVGWELAALRSPVSLQQAINCFEDGGTCDFDKSAEYSVDGNPHNPYYHLIDPDWVMKAPDVRCEAYAYSSVLESPETSNRQKYCADLKVCLREDSEGNCIEDQFNYCTRSENIWNFDGKACDYGELYSGCLTFSNEDFGDNSYIEDSLEYCTADQAGCRRYSQDRDESGNWILDDIISDDNDLFLNAQAVDCKSDVAGCNEYIVLAPDTGVNIIANGSFNNLDEDSSVPFPNGTPDGWIDSATGLAGDGIEYDGSRLANGRSFNPNPNPDAEGIYQKVLLTPNTTYRLSASAGRYVAAQAAQARVIVELCDISGNCGDDSLAHPLEEGVGGDCLVDQANHPQDADLRFNVVSESMQRATCTFTTNNQAISMAKVLLQVTSGSTNALWFDDIKLEIISDINSIVVSPYSAYGNGARIYMDDNAFMCTADELGCQGYIPENGDPMIPAVITQSDLCPAQCVGYETFSEQITSFDTIEGDLLVEYYNFIPETAQECPDQEIGCEEFTNLDVVAEGGEGREYFTYLRQCVEEGQGTIYYTWEGTDVEGYQIKTWYALASDGFDGANGSSPTPDAPCTNMAPEGGNCLDTVANIAICGLETPADTSDDPENDPNCRIFFDESGNEHYRFQDRVIFATNNCHDYRRTLTGQIYKAVPDESITCAAANNGCRSYYGNNANNIRLVLADNFEGGTYEPWSGVDLSNVSLNNNGHSLKAQTGVQFERNVIDANFQNDKEYKISWWMKSDVQLDGLTVTLNAEDSAGVTYDNFIINTPTNPDSNFQNIGANHWNYYTTSFHTDGLNSLNLDEIDVFKIIIDSLASIDNQGLYIDNFTIKEIENHFSVVRNSWDTPIECDQPYDAYHLGCQSYKDLNGRPFNLKSFDHLCREDAIGCMSVIDTHNSTNPFEETFNEFDYSELTVAADSLTYLVPNPDNYCPQTAKGCSALGEPDRLDETQFYSVYKINDPDKYNSILCDYDGLGCSEYNTAKGVFYLKDPGSETCTYQQNILIEDNLLSGWFKTETLNDEVPLGCADTDGDYDTDGDGYYDLREIVLANDYCSVSEIDPTQEFFFTKQDCEDNGHYWKNYLLAAQCPASENLCTSFRDPVDPINCDPKGRNLSFIDFYGYCSNPADDNESDCLLNAGEWIFPSLDGYCTDSDYNNEKDCEDEGLIWTAYCKNYHYYYDSEIDESSCNGSVDRQEGCVLFYEANSWNGEHSQTIAIYDTAETYEDIEADNRSASPVVCDSNFDPTCTLDSNKLIKVTKDRQCSEWLACKSSTASYDPNTDQYKIICDDLASCLEFQYDADSNTTRCKTWGSHDEGIEALTFEKYQSRDTGLRGHISWSDKEYTGYSVPNMLPIDSLSVKDFGDDEDSVIRLTYNITDTVVEDTPVFADCVDDSVSPAIYLDGQACSEVINTDGDYIFRGECQDGACWVSPQANAVGTSAYAIETRAYAIADAPFSSSIESIDLKRLAKYKGANICENDLNSCEDSFSKVDYGNGQKTLYYTEDFSDIPDGICTSGILVNPEGGLKTCSENSDCDSDDSRHDGSCSVKTKEIVFKNWPGICLEYDFNNLITRDGDNSYYCNQWYPAQKIKGTASLYDNYKEAGYFEPNGRDAEFCSVAEPYLTTEPRYYCAASVSVVGFDYCSVLALVPEGARVKIDSINEYLDIIRYSYLDIENMRRYAPDEAASSEGVNFSGLGVDWLERNGATALFTGNPGGNHPSSLPLSAGASTINGSSLFFTKDFDPLQKLGLEDYDSLPVLPLNYLDNIFDTDDSGPVTMFYYDTKIDKNGNYTYRGAVIWPWRIGSPLTRYPIGLQHDYGVALTDDEVEQDLNQCNDGYHESWYNDYLDGNYNAFPSSGFDQRGWDGGGRLERDRWCSPMAHGIYIRPAFPFNAPDMEICEEVDCNNTLTCLNNDEPYQNILTPDPCPANDDACLYKKCIEDVPVDSHAGVTWCSDFGDIENNTLSIIYECSGFMPDKTRLFTNVTNILGCSEYIYETEITSIPVDYDGCTTGAGQSYNRLVTKSTVNLNLTQQVTSCSPQLNTSPPAIEGAHCHIEAMSTDWPWFDLARGTQIHSRITIVDIDSTFHPDIEGSLCEGLDCYQQCRVVTHLDSLGALSAVRTDIWWRNKKEPEQRISNYVWESWYIDDSANYAQYDDVLYSDIESKNAIQEGYPSNFSHFGAALGNFEEGSVVGTRAPFYRDSLIELSAATFFAYMLNDSDRDDALVRANLELGSLFYRVYNFDWHDNLHSYIYLGESDLSLSDNHNPRAGSEYYPRILAACGDQLCETLDVDGNVIDVLEGLTINNMTEGRVIGRNASLFVNLKLFYHAHPDHMPITSVSVDWGDEPGSIFVSNTGRYKNALPAKWCDSELDAPGNPHGDLLEPRSLGFSGTDEACQDGYKIFYHDYFYDETQTYRCDGTLGKPNIENASCYKPNIRIIDNWGAQNTEPFAGWVVVRRGN